MRNKVEGGGTVLVTVTIHSHNSMLCCEQAIEIVSWVQGGCSRTHYVGSSFMLIEGHGVGVVFMHF